MCEGVVIHGMAITAGQSLFSVQRRTTGVHERARRGMLLVELHLLTSVTVTTEIPGVGGVSHPGEKENHQEQQAGCNMIPISSRDYQPYIQNVNIPY